ncbi:MFS transporter [Agromyces bauzanensis]
MTAAGYLIAATPLRLAVGGLTVALPILAIEEHGDIALGGALAAACLAPSIVAAPIVGAVLDRTRHPRAVIALAGAITALGIVVAAFLGPVPPTVVAIAVMLAGSVTPFFMGGLSSFATEEVEDEHRAYAIDSLAYNFGSIGGPAIVAVAAALGSARVAMLVMAATAAIGSVAVAMTRLRPLATPVAGIWRSMGAGLRHIVGHRPIAVITASGTVSQFGAGALGVAAVALTTTRLGSPDEGALIVTAFAVGGLIGAFLISVRAVRLAPEVTMGVGFACTGVLTIAAAGNFGLAWTTVAIGLSGLFTAPSSAAMLLLRKQQSPPELRSQVFTVGAGLRATAGAIGAGLAGVAAVLGGELLVAAIGVVWIVAAVMLFAYPRSTELLDR